jgi:hypothetical protein
MAFIWARGAQIVSPVLTVFLVQLLEPDVPITRQTMAHGLQVGDFTPKGPRELCQRVETDTVHEHH